MNYKQKRIKKSELVNIPEKEGRMFRITYTKYDNPIFRYERIFKSKKNIGQWLNKDIYNIRLYVMEEQE